ncbi:UBX domain-containing protein [Aphelenchoides bicaudatus]|nr:UBX domain-containing protein [Aphelenchoides bicaudatus]
MEEPLNREEILNSFKDICAVNDEIAQAALESNNWNLETALRVFLDGEDHFQQQPEVEREEINQQRRQEIEQPRNVPNVSNAPTHGNQTTSFVDWLTGFALAPIRIAVWSLRFLFDFFYSLFGGQPLPVADPRTEVTQFVEDFRTHYDSDRQIPWLEVPYNSAVSEARRNISYLLVYIHNPSHRRVEDFSQNYLLSPEFLSFIRENNCLIWGASVRSSEGYKVCSALHDFNYPFVALLCMVEGRATCIFRMSGEYTLAALMDGLRNSSQAGQGVLNQMHQERLVLEFRESSQIFLIQLSQLRLFSAQREMDTQLRREQESEYQRSLATDRARVQERKRLESEKLESQKREEELRLQEEQKAANLEERRHQIKQSLPVEPAINGAEIVRVAVRFPSGQKFERRFNVDDSLELLFNAVFANENCPKDFSILSSYPRKELKCAPAWYQDFSTADVFSGSVQTFREAGLNGPIALLIKDNAA